MTKLEKSKLQKLRRNASMSQLSWMMYSGNVSKMVADDMNYSNAYSEECGEMEREMHASLKLMWDFEKQLKKKYGSKFIMSKEMCDE